MTAQLRALPTRDLVELVRVAGRVRPGLLETVVDGGAGIGDTAKPMLDAGAAHVYAYDPLPENVVVLGKRFADEPRVTVRPVAIGETPGRAVFMVPSRITHDSGAWAAGTSFNGYLQRGPRDRIKRVVKSALATIQRSGPAALPVTVVRLDADLPTAPDVVKLDLQGAEAEALAGLGSWLTEVKVIQVELQLLHARDTHVLDLLREAGFAIYLTDVQFDAAGMPDDLRDGLAAAGVLIEKEWAEADFTGSRTMYLGSWADGDLPVRGQGLAPELARLLKVAGADYFQTDIVALNGRVDWADVLAAATQPAR